MPYGTGVTFWALGEIVKAHAGILEAESATTAAEKLATAVREALRDDPEAAWVEAHLRTSSASRARTARGTTGARRRSSRGGVSSRRWPARVRSCSSSKTCTGPTTESARLHRPRARVGERRSAAHPCSGRDPSCSSAGPAGGRPAEQPAASARGASSRGCRADRFGTARHSPCSAATRTALLERAGGNPSTRSSTRASSSSGGSRGAAAVTLQGLIAARLDALALADKELLQAAAVIGKVFWTGSVAAVAAGTRGRSASVSGCSSTGSCAALEGLDTHR